MIIKTHPRFAIDVPVAPGGFCVARVDVSNRCVWLLTGVFAPDGPEGEEV